MPEVTFHSWVPTGRQKFSPQKKETHDRLITGILVVFGMFLDVFLKWLGVILSTSRLCRWKHCKGKTAFIDLLNLHCNTVIKIFNRVIEVWKQKGQFCTQAYIATRISNNATAVCFFTRMHVRTDKYWRSFAFNTTFAWEFRKIISRSSAENYNGLHRNKTTPKCANNGDNGVLYSVRRH